MIIHPESWLTEWSWQKRTDGKIHTDSGGKDVDTLVVDVEQSCDIPSVSPLIGL